MASFKGEHGGGHKRGALHKIEIRKAANGFAVSKHHEGEGMMMGAPEPPAVFTKHAPMMKHVKTLAQQMHPGLPSGGEPNELAAGSPTEEVE